MNFLAPLFLLGALAVALPIVFHLIRRTSKERRTFSSLMFLRPTPPRVTRRNRLENIFLLLLRCLALCLLALGFARPFFPKPMLTGPQNDAEKKIILLVDTSASMRRQDLWPAALDKAEEVLRGTAPGDKVAVLTFDAQPQSLVSFEQWSALNAGERGGVTAKQLRQLQPGWAATHLGNALIAAAEAFADADKQGQNIGIRRIVLITDLQEGSRLDGLQGYEWPRGIEVVVEQLQAKRPTNAGLQWVVDADAAVASGAEPGPRVRVSNSGDAKREQFQLHWDGITGAAPLDIYVPPRQSRIVPARNLPAGAAGERLALTGDDDDFDNRIYRVQPEPEQIKVLFLGDDAEKDPNQLLYYVKRAFQQTRRQTVEVIAQAGDGALSQTNVASARLLILAAALSEDRFRIVERFLTEGGSVMFVLKEAASVQALGRLAGIDHLAATEASAAGYAMLGQIDFEHPLFAPFADPRFSDFTKIHFWKHRRIQLAEPRKEVRVLARFDDGDPALVEVTRGKGRLLALMAGWNPADSQLALSSKFVPLLYSILEQTGGINARLAQYQVGDAVPLGSDSSNRTWTIRKPDGAQVQLAAGETRFKQTDLPGIYTITSAQPPLRFAVNLEAAESRTAPLPAEELMGLGVPLKPREVGLTKQIEQKRRLHDAELENEQKLWRRLIVAALVVLLAETWLAGWLTRRTTVARA